MNVNEAKKIFREGYLAMDKNKSWAWYIAKPFKAERSWFADGGCDEEDHYALLRNIDPVDDWETSLTICGV